MRVGMYVDGFNLYYGERAVCGRGCEDLDCQKPPSVLEPGRVGLSIGSCRGQLTPVKMMHSRSLVVCL